MRDLVILLVHLIATLAKLLLPGGARAVVAESLLLKHQLLILNRSRARAPNLRPIDRVIASLCAGLMRPTRLLRSAIVLKPSTIMAFHRALVKRKYRLLFTPKQRRKPGPKGPAPPLIAAIIEMKRRNPAIRLPADRSAALLYIRCRDRQGCRAPCARQALPAHTRLSGPSWLTLLGHSKDSLWSVDLFRCESLILRTHWVMVVMDLFTRRIIGFAVQAGTVDGPAICRMFNHAIAGELTLPRHLSSDHDPLFEFHRWKANLRILDVTEIKTVPEVPLSHPFIERLIGTLRREFLDQIPFWSAGDLERKLLHFRDYYNRDRVHASLGGATPACKAGDGNRRIVSLSEYQWQSHCRGLYQLPMAA